MIILTPNKWKFNTYNINYLFIKIFKLNLYTQENSI